MCHLSTKEGSVGCLLSATSVFYLSGLCQAPRGATTLLVLVLEPPTMLCYAMLCCAVLCYAGGYHSPSQLCSAGAKPCIPDLSKPVSFLQLTLFLHSFFLNKVIWLVVEKLSRLLLRSGLSVSAIQSPLF